MQNGGFALFFTFRVTISVYGQLVSNGDGASVFLVLRWTDVCATIGVLVSNVQRFFWESGEK